MYTNDVYARLQNVKSALEKDLVRSEAWGKSVLSVDEVDVKDRNDPNEMGKYHSLYKILDLLGDAYDLIRFYEMPVKVEGTACKNENDRYEINGHELTSGMLIEILDDSDPDEPNAWIRCSVEHDGSDYYAAYGRLSLGGRRVRIR